MRPAVGELDLSTTILITALESIWIQAEYQGQGLARRLLTEARPITKVHSCVAVSSHCLSFPAPGFFRQLGYGIFGRVDVFAGSFTENSLIKRL